MLPNGARARTIGPRCREREQRARNTFTFEVVSALIVAKLDRLSRSMLDFTALMVKAQKQSWALVALDCAVDISTPTG